MRKVQQMDLDDYLDKLEAKDQTIEGAELPDPKPMAPPIGYNPQPSLIENIRNMVRSEALRQAVEAQGAETFEEADDFDVPDAFEPVSAFEMEPEFEPPVAVARKASQEAAGAVPAPAAAEPPPGAALAPTPAPAGGG